MAHSPQIALSGLPVLHKSPLRAVRAFTKSDSSISLQSFTLTMFDATVPSM